MASIPRLDADVRVDGRLDEETWTQAARLSGFHQFQPVDGRPAEETTEVLVWYSPRAIHFGILAHAKNPETIRATLADRDNIDNDDRVTIYLDTFRDRRRAFFFVVNPLGVQADGVRTEGAVSAGNIFGGNVDYNPDFFFESKGHVTASGYEVEVRIPFKSLRFAGGGPQQWGLNVVRNVPQTGYEDTWTDVRRASASFLAQAGTVEGLHDLERGVVTELQPFITTSANGSRDEASGRFVRGSADPSTGANLRLGFSQLSLDATVNPDFSQVESDAGLVTVNERFDLFIPEKRPFFLEGIELFATPNQLVYTRRIVDPLGGAKVTGKLGAYSIAHLSAMDERGGTDALFNIARVRRDIGGNSVAGVTATDYERSGEFNRVAAADVRIVFGGLYYVEGQGGGSATRVPAGGGSWRTLTSPIWKAEFDRTGRAWGFNYQLNGIGQSFASYAGFVPRSDVTSFHAFNRFSWYGARGALLENLTSYFGPTRVWDYDAFGRAGALEGRDEITAIARLRGGWSLTATAARQFFALDPSLYQYYTVDRGGGIEPYDAPDEISGLIDALLELDTPLYQTFNAIVRVSRTEVPIFAEGSEGTEMRGSVNLSLRPTTSFRVNWTGVLSRITRQRDGSEFARVFIPRLKLEYQLTRAVRFRAVGEYTSARGASFLDAETGDSLLVGGVIVPAVQSGGLRVDWLASYEPTPGTVAFLGYGSSHTAPSATSLSALRRAEDGFFVKLAYQFRR